MTDAPKTQPGFVPPQGVDPDGLKRLVHTFYARVRDDDLLGPIFNREVADWPGKVSAAVYGVALAAQPIGVAVAFGTDAQWAIGLQLLSAILGGGLAAARAPQPGGETFVGEVATDRYGY